MSALNFGARRENLDLCLGGNGVLQLKVLKKDGLSHWIRSLVLADNGIDIRIDFIVVSISILIELLVLPVRAIGIIVLKDLVGMLVLAAANCC
jgi:hypothetical protein